MIVSIYTGHEQTEQPMVIYGVTSLTTLDDLLTIECDVNNDGHTFLASHRFERGMWTHFEVTRL